MLSWLRISLLLCLVLGCSAGRAALAQESRPTRPQRLRFDADRGEWVDLPRLEPGTDSGDLAAVRSLLADARYRKAHKSIKRWLKRYGDTSVLFPEALLMRGQVEKARRNYHVSQEILSQLSQEYQGTAQADEATAELFNIAEVFLSGVRRKVWGVRLLRANDLALDILDGIAVRFPDSSLAEQAVKAKADFHFRQGDFALSELEYARLVQMFPKSRYVRYAMRRSADAALASFAGIRFDDAPLIEAQERYRLYAQQYRGLAEQEQIGLILADIREKRGSKELDIGAYYQQTGHPKAAAFYYRSTVTNWPDTIAANKASAALKGAVGHAAGQQKTPALTGSTVAERPLDGEGG